MEEGEASTIWPNSEDRFSAKSMMDAVARDRDGRSRCSSQTSGRVKGYFPSSLGFAVTFQFGHEVVNDKEW